MKNQEWVSNTIGSILKIERTLRNELKESDIKEPMTHADTLKMAIEIHRNIILEQSLQAGYTETTQPLEMIAMALMGK